jgi:nucleotide-binding universal stress UspA family protein
MNTLKTILVAVDFSAGASAALKEAARLAAVHEASLHVLHVVDVKEVDASVDADSIHYEQQALAAMQSASISLTLWLEQMQAPNDCEVTIVVGAPLVEILAHAQKLHADLVVAGVSGAGESKAGAGSVASKLARRASPQILLVSPVHPPKTVRKITACIDFSDASREVAEVARQLALHDGAHVDFLHVWNEPWLSMSYDAPVADATTKFRDNYIEDLRGSLKEFVSDAAQGIECSEVLYNSANHGHGIASYAEESDTDLIMVGGKGRSNLHYMLLGSIAERMLGTLPCSVLVVKRPAE